MATRMDDSFAFVVAAPSDRSEDVLFEDGDFVFHRFRYIGIPESRYPETGFHFCEEPGGTESGTADHDGIDAVAIEAFFRALGCTHIPVPYNGYAHARVILHRADEGPIGFTAVHLAARATMDSEFLNTAVLESFGKINDEGCSIGQIEARFIPTKAGFAGDGSVNGIDNRFGDLEHFWYIFEQTCACSFARHFLNRTSEIDIDEIGMSLLDYTRSIRHTLGVTSVDLDGDRSLGIMDGEFASRGSYIAYQSIGVHELRIDAIGAETLA